MEHLKALAKVEDAWDACLRQEGVSPHDEVKEEPDMASWTIDVQSAISRLKNQQAREVRKNHEMTAKMWSVVLKERELQRIEEEECRGESKRGESRDEHTER